jgi:uncharacterized protein (DUF362 family)
VQDNEIHVIYGRDQYQMTYDLLGKINLAAELRPGLTVGLKPNLVVAKKASEGATTSPAIVEGVICYLRDNGVKSIAIMEGSWVGDDTKRAYAVCGYKDLAAKYGIPLYDLKDDAYVTKRVAELELKICKKPLEVDLLINMPVLKAHCQTALTCALKNLKGCIPDSEKRRFHNLGLHKPIGYLGQALKPGLTIVDAIAGDLSFEEGGNPVAMDRIIAGKDPVLIDTYAAALLGYATEDIAYIGIAEKVGAGSTALAAAKISEYDVGLKNGASFKPSQRTRRLAEKVTAEAACSACYGSLIHALQRLDDSRMLASLRQPVYIGQAFRNKALPGLGIGSCAGHCARHVAGCPPTAKDIVAFLTANLGSR